MGAVPHVCGTASPQISARGSKSLAKTKTLKLIAYLLIITESGHFSFADTGLLDELRFDTLAPDPSKDGRV